MSRYWSPHQQVSSAELANERFEEMNLGLQERELMRAAGIGRVIASDEWMSDLRDRFKADMPSGLAVTMRRFPAVTYATGQMLAANPDYQIFKNDKSRADPRLSVDMFLADLYEQGKLGDLSKEDITVPFLHRLMLTPIGGGRSLLVAHIGDFYPEYESEEWHGIADGLIESERIALEEAVDEKGVKEAKKKERSDEKQRENFENPPADWEDGDFDEDEHIEPERFRHKLHLGAIEITARSRKAARKRAADEAIRGRIENKLGGQITLRAVGIAPVLFTGLRSR